MLLSDRDKHLLDAIAKFGIVDIKFIMELLTVSRESALRTLKRLITKSHIKVTDKYIPHFNFVNHIYKSGKKFKINYQLLNNFISGSKIKLSNCLE